MILFWIICALMVSIALAFVLPPLLQRDTTQTENTEREANVEIYRDQLSELENDLQNGIIAEEQYRQDRDEIERRLLEDVAAAGPKKAVTKLAGRRLVYVIALGIPALAIGLYFRIGSPSAISASPTSVVRSPATPSGPTAPRSQGDIEANVAALARRLEQNPADVSGWKMLGRSYLSMERYKEASDAFAKAAALEPNNADLLSDYAFALAMASGQRLQGQPQELIEKALKLDPDNPKALELAGSAAFEARNYKAAAAYWERLLKMTPADSELAPVLTERINRAKALAGGDAK
jgi:cytochrome c-type biogenesis protein CcmH